MKLYVVDEVQLRAMELIAKRLFTEQRMNGDDMRNYAQALSHIAKVCKDIPIPEEKDNV